MHLLYVIESLSLNGGAERIVAERLNFLARNTDYRLTLVEVYDYGNGSIYTVDERISRVQLGIRKTSIAPLKVFTFARVLSQLNKVVGAIRPDIVCGHTLLGLIFLSLLPLKGVKKIYESHVPRHELPLKFLLPRLECHVDRIVTLTEGDAREYKIQNKVSVIGNFTLLDATLPDDVRHCHRAIAVGRFVRRKGFDELIRAWKTVAERHPEWSLSIVGDGQERQSLEDLICQYGLQGKVVLLPYTSDIEKEYSKSAFLVMPSLFEGFPLVLIEAMTKGLPVVAYDCCYGPSEVIRNGENGFLVPLHDIQRLAESMTAAIEDADLRERMSRNTHAAVRRYALAEIMSQWQELYKTLLDR